MGNVCTSQSYFLQDIHQLFLVHQQVFFPQMHIVTSAGLLQHSWGIGSLTFKTKRFNYFFPEISRFLFLNLPLLLCWRSLVCWWAWQRWRGSWGFKRRLKHLIMETNILNALPPIKFSVS